MLGAGLPSLSAQAALAAPSEATFTFLRSDDAGDSFDAPLQLDDRNRGMNITKVDASDGTVHALFDTDGGEDPPSVLYRRSGDEGRNFDDSIRLDVDAAGDPDDLLSTEAEGGRDDRPRGLDEQRRPPRRQHQPLL